MIIDGLWRLTGGAGGVGNNDGATDSPTTGTQTSSNSADLGITSGIPSSASGGGARDIGIGDDPALKWLIQVQTAFASGTSLQVNVQGAADNGSGVAGAFTTMIAGPVVVEANLIVGARLFEVDMPRPVPGQALPRFIQLQYVTVGTHTAGKLSGQLVLDRHDQPLQSNAVLGGYAAGVNVAN